MKGVLHALVRLARELPGPARPTPRPRRPLDPWLDDNIRKTEISAAAARDARRGWIPHRPDWLTSRRRWR